MEISKADGVRPIQKGRSCQFLHARHRDQHAEESYYLAATNIETYRVKRISDLLRTDYVLMASASLVQYSTSLRGCEAARVARWCDAALLDRAHLPKATSRLSVTLTDALVEAVSFSNNLSLNTR